MNTRLSELPIGVFDSGIGGFTVATALQRRLPHESLLYLGDTARLPYGTKSPETVVRYALQAAAFFVGRGVKMLVVACNTASAHALPALTRAYPSLPVLGVVDAGAASAASRSPDGRIVVIATEGTCRSGAFETAIRAARPQAAVTSAACPLFVALAEEGLTDGPIAEAMAHHYLDGLFTGPGGNDTLVLGCTHFPLLAPTLRKVIGEDPVMVDCAEAVAQTAAERLDKSNLLSQAVTPGALTLATTDAPDRFSRIGRAMFPHFPEAMAELVDL